MKLVSLTSPQGVQQAEEKTTAFVNKECFQSGTLYIAESCLCWINETGFGFTIEYPVITIHAISKDLSSFPSECIFIVLDICFNETLGGCAGDATADVIAPGYTEVRFVPNNISSLSTMFHTMNVCQRLHPDKDECEDDVDEETDDDELDLMPEADQIIFQRINSSDTSVGIISHIDDDLDRIESAIGQMMSNGSGRYDEQMETGLEDTDQFDDAECDH